MKDTLRNLQDKKGRRPMEPNEIERAVRTRLRSLRNTLGLSLDELAARAKLSPSTISRVETGKRTISLDVLLPLASASRSIWTSCSTYAVQTMSSSDPLQT